RQREWRIVECGLTQNGQPLAPRANDVQKQTLFSLDNEFFSKKVRMPSSSGRIGEWDSEVIADRCRFLSRVVDLDVVSLAKFFVVPDNCLKSSVAEMFRRRGIAVVTAGNIPSE